MTMIKKPNCQILWIFQCVSKDTSAEEALTSANPGTLGLVGTSSNLCVSVFKYIMKYAHVGRVGKSDKKSKLGGKQCELQRSCILVIGSL